ncbi:hypothetical protein MTR67_039059 [Solanum verrucosum]|uniref:Uncharacterized protein n=1 Tax=Solanum verrucosum TaxID=315347 RepID=A0AAF0UHZ1_SOLVR|nr:hypothetical protein MTR67_039059 [Solanum verrucosum]
MTLAVEPLKNHCETELDSFVMVRNEESFFCLDTSPTLCNGCLYLEHVHDNLCLRWVMPDSIKDVYTDERNKRFSEGISTPNHSLKARCLLDLFSWDSLFPVESHLKLLDFVKSRMMGDSVYKNTFDCFFRTLKYEVILLSHFLFQNTWSFVSITYLFLTWLMQGPLAFYKGFLPNFFRLGSWNVIMFLTLEQVSTTPTLGLKP